MTQIGSDECFMPLLKWIRGCFFFLLIHAGVMQLQTDAV